MVRLVIDMSDTDARKINDAMGTWLRLLAKGNEATWDDQIEMGKAEQVIVRMIHDSDAVWEAGYGPDHKQAGDVVRGDG